MQYLKFLLLSILIGSVVLEENEPIVEITNGKLLGEFNGNYYSFKGIPYAEPPIGENRFESPKAFENKWKNVRNATQFGNTCLRLDPLIKIRQNILDGSEDCLTINVYTPNIQPDKLYPVIVFIHGGAFMFGNGHLYREELLMKRKSLIFVTFNYRLGPLGFLSTEDDQISGNMGLKDQRLALQWIKNNAKVFGGDPEHILLTGFSAGSASVQFQLLKPGIENLISAAASFSGSALNAWAIKSNPLKDAKKVGNILKCSETESTVELKKCLKKAPAEEIVKSSEHFQPFNANPTRVFGPTIEPKTSIDAIITEDPRDLIKNGKFAKLPYLLSSVSEDGAFLNSELTYVKPDGTTDLEYFNKNYKSLLPVMLMYGGNTKNEQDEHTEQLYKKFNLTDQQITLDNFGQLSKLFTYDAFKKGIDESLRLHKQFSKGPTYSYLYSHPSSFSLAHFIANRTDINFGCVHGDDVELMYNLEAKGPIKFTDVEQKISDNFVGMLETFATTGVPKYGDINLPGNIRESENLQYLKITEESATIENLK